MTADQVLKALVCFIYKKNRHVCAISPIQAVFSGEFTVNTFMFMSPTKNQPKSPTFSLNLSLNTQVNRMSKSRRVLATGGKQRSFGLHMVCFEMVLYHNEPH